MNNKSIIGFGYKPNNAKAVCLKTNCETRLGDVEYKIIADPYEREFVRVISQPLSLFSEEKKVRYNSMAVNVLDPVTGLTYAVEYAPANLVRTPKGYKWGDVEITIGGARVAVKKPKEHRPAAMTPDTFLRRMKEIVEEIDEMTEENPELKERCAVAFFAAKSNGTEKTADGVCLVSGKEEILADSILIPAKKDKIIADMIVKIGRCLCWRQ